MLHRTLALAAGPLLAALLLSAAHLAAQENGPPSDDETPTALDDSGAEKPTWNRATRPAQKLVPFPEDAEEPARMTEPQRPDSTPLRSAPKSNFQPRFKAPAVRQATHNAPADSRESSGPELQGVPADRSDDSTDRPSVSSGRAAVDEAFEKAKTCKADTDYTAVIDLCRQGMKAGLKKNYDEYARRLMGWAYNRRGELRADESKEQEALADFEAAVECNGSWRAIHNRGVSYASMGRLKEALADFDRTIEMFPQYTNAFFNRGELKYEQGDYAGAIHDYTSALKLGPPDPATYNSRGHAFYRMQRFGDALRDYGEAIKMDPENAAALINRGDTFSDMGQYGEAARDYRAAVRVAPKLGRAYQSAAWLMATCPDEHYRNNKLSIDAAKKAIELDGADYRNLSTLAAAQANAGEFEEARKTEGKAIAKASPGDRPAAEKMLSLYQRELAYRDHPRNTVADPHEPNEVRQASGTSSDKGKSSKGRPQRTAPSRYY